jgi:NADPH-dependent curcumin reductase CurA
MGGEVSNKTWVFKQSPSGLPEPGVHTTFEDRPLSLVAPPGGLVIKLLTAGLDPHQRDRMRGAGNVDYVPGYEVNEPITNFSIAKVIRSDNEAFEEGSLIAGSLPIAEYGIIPKELIDARAMASPLVWKVSNDYNLDVKHYVGTLGLAGMTAWNSFYGLVKPVKGETIWVNAASSSVGEVVVQLAKIEGMKVIASVSSDDKLDYVVNELGADVGFNYRKEPVGKALKRLAPDGLDVVFENVGGDHFQAAIENMKWFGRIISCGTVSLSSTHPFASLTLSRLLSTTSQLRNNTASPTCRRSSADVSRSKASFSGMTTSTQTTLRTLRLLCQSGFRRERLNRDILSLKELNRLTRRFCRCSLVEAMVRRYSRLATPR